MIEQYIDSLLENSTIRDKKSKQYELGFYNNNTPVCGCYLKAKKGSVLEKVENMAKKKFNLEKDSENYAQEARVIFFIKLEEYIDEYGEPITQQEEDKMNAFLFTSCKNYMTDLSRQVKGNTYYDYSTEKDEQFKLIQSISLDVNNSFTQILQGQVEQKLEMEVQNSYSIFREWLNENKKEYLTKKQLEYLENENLVDISNRKKINRSISERILPHYNKNSMYLNRLDKIEKEGKKIQNLLKQADILTSNQFIELLIEEIQGEQWLFEIIEKELEHYNRKIFLNMYNNSILINYYWTHQKNGFWSIAEEIYEILLKISEKYFTRYSQVKSYIC